MTIRSTHLDFGVTPRLRTATRGIVVHHTAGNPQQSIEDIHADHKARGWIGIGYNLVQRPDARWYEGRPIEAEGAHATGYNRTHIGICLTGNHETHTVAKDRYESLILLLAQLCKRYGLEYTDTRGHNELPGAATLCPGKHLDMSQVRHDLWNALGGAYHPSDPIALPQYRVIVDSVQKGVFRHPEQAVLNAVASRAGLISLIRVADPHA